MAPDLAQYNRIEMPAEEIDRLLREEGVDVLSLADDGVTYRIPSSLGYDVDRGRLHFVFFRPDEFPKKAEFAERTARASFTVWSAPLRDQWGSVVVDGGLHQADDGDWDRIRDVLEDNAWYPALFSETEPMQDILSWKFRIDSWSGLQHQRVRAPSSNPMVPRRLARLEASDGSNT